MKILIKDEEVFFNKSDFPMLINGKAFVKSGASFFSVSLMTKLFESGEKIVFFTGFDPAKELFKNQINGRTNNNIIIIPTGNEDDFIKELDKIKDLNERIILFKNIEEYTIKLLNKLKDHKYVIFSGDIDKCEFTNELLKINFKTKIFFSYSENKGLIISSKYNGIISL